MMPPTISCGARIQVTNNANERSVVVTVTDTGRFRSGAILDLSRAAFSAIAPTAAGVVRVRVVPLASPASQNRPRSQAGAPSRGTP